jgi:hypothetical protein
MHPGMLRDVVELRAEHLLEPEDAPDDQEEAAVDGRREQQNQLPTSNITCEHSVEHEV